MIKRYSSPCSKFTNNIKVDGKPMAIVFDMYDRNAKRRFALIPDGEVQKQMESSAGYGIYFTLDEGYHADENVPVVTEEVKVAAIPETIEEIEVNVHDCETLAEAKKYLSEMGIRVYPSMNRAKAVEAALKNNIVLTIKN